MSRPANEMVQMFTLPSEYERAAAEARRRKRMAELLASQEYDPSTVRNAPIPAAAPLVQGLQAFLKARAGRKAEEAEKTAEKAGRKELMDYIRSFEPEERTVGVGDIAAMEAGMPKIDSAGRVSYAPASVVAAPNQRVVPAMTAAGEPDINQPLQMRIGGPLSLAQKRARALEGFESENPLVREFALSQYEKTMPKELDLKIAALDPSKVDMASVDEAQRTGDISKIKPLAAAPEAMTPYQKRMLELRERELGIRERGMGPGGQKPMSPTTQRELFETDENILATQTGIDLLQTAKTLSPKAFEGPLAEKRAQAATLLPDEIEPAGAKETLEFDLLVKQQVLPQLRTIFGAAPTEGERAILLELQGSSSLPKKVRDSVLNRAIQAAQRRLQFNKQKSDQLRSGTYFQEAPAELGNSLPSGFELDQ